MPTRKTKPAADVAPTDDPTAVKDPATWTTGGEPMTGAQESYVHTLARQAGEEEELPADMTKAEASEKIDELQDKTGRGKSGLKGPTAAKKGKKAD